ncbi:Structure-specific endonuclease subunit SLX4 [Ooceraea biroi]|uniref:Structure-specific endonuclease subunit SLX4 n=1 Tax=Ooceraea biroi TaxID=2015173 RepID=A0A026VU40_OOCBI|nr:Structure-specific endonuclease subunit SLX4 [Ooceraea biroi]
MDLKEGGLCKPSSPERRLRLRKDKESADNKTRLSTSNDKCEKNDTTCTSQSQCDDDSILDFKSPKRMYSVQPTIISSNKYTNKSKKKPIPHSKSKPINNDKKIEGKPSHSRKILHDVQQPPIESSFFKSEKKADPADVKTACVCPLCFKNFKDESSQAIHMKSCAIKNNVSTKKLMVAVELQERQAAERKSLGLLSAPALQEKKKPAPRKLASHDDPDLQLALALSKSLHEKEEMEEWGEQMMVISSNPLLPDNNAEQCRKTTLQSFGFISDRNISPADNLSNKTKRKRPIERTILQRRTAVERERILAERIAEILMGYRDFTQGLQEEEERSDNVEKKIIIKNRLLQELRQTENTLWDRTRLTASENVFYVDQLLPQTTPSKKEQKKSKKAKEVETVEAAVDEEELTISSNEMKACCKEKRFLDIFVKSWGDILNDSSASDIIILVRNGKHIWTHKLVFYVRCANILLDVISNDTEFATAKEKISWIDTDYDVALAFLEFVYCGVINRNSKVLDIDASLSSIRGLARKYKVNDLFAYLRQRELTSDVTKVEDDSKNCENVESIRENVETTSGVLKLNESTSNTSSNHTRDGLDNNLRPREALLQEDNIDSFEDNHTSIEESYVLESENIILMKSPDKIKSRNNTPTKFDFSASPDMFDDAPDVTKYNDTSTMCSEEQEDSNINILLSLIKQDADADISSQRSPVRRPRSAEHSESIEDTATCSKNVEQDVIEIDSDSESNSVKPPTINNSLQKNSSSDAAQSSKSSIPNQKSDLTLFIEKIQRQNAKSDSDLDTDSDIECDVQISPMRHKNPFHIDKRIPEDAQSSNAEQPISTNNKPGRLSIMERCIQSYANKNPEFYSHCSSERENGKQTETLHPISVSPKTLAEPYDDTLYCTKNFTSPAEKDSNLTKQVVTAPPSATTSQSSNESISDVEVNETEISMYSKYMKDHKDNSIAKYRAVIEKNASDSDLSNESTSSTLVNESNEIDERENDEVLTQDVDIIVSSDTEIESISSSVSCPVQDDDADHENPMFRLVQQSKKSRENNGQNIEDKENGQSVSIPKAVTTTLEEQRDSSGIIGSNHDSVNSSTGSKSDNVNLNAYFTQNTSRLNKSRDNQKGFIPNSTATFSSLDFSNVESRYSDGKDCNKFMSESSNNCELKKSIEHSFNFEDDIYLANVDVEKYEKREQQALERSQSSSVLTLTEFRKSNARRCTNKNNNKNIKTSGIADDITSGNLDRNRTSLTQNFAAIRTFKKKSLSEGQISSNILRNQETTFKDISSQLQCSYSQKIGDAKIEPKIFDKDVTPSPHYNSMSSPELHKEMKKYGLKIQKRSRAVKLLSHIYNELHPLIPTTEVIPEEKVTEISSDEDDGPPKKKRNVEDNYVEKPDNVEGNDDELLCSQDSNKSINSLKDRVSKEMEFYETESYPPLENSSDITKAFTKLINLDKALYNKILQYEPINIEELRSTLRTHGFKCKLPNLMSFLDEQCITFYVPEQSSRSRIRKKT